MPHPGQLCHVTIYVYHWSDGTLRLRAHSRPRWARLPLAFEILLFEWKPRSLVQVALASATAGLLRQFIIGPAAIFPAPSHPAFLRSFANRMPEHRLTRASVVA